MNDKNAFKCEVLKSAPLSISELRGGDIEKHRERFAQLISRRSAEVETGDKKKSYNIFWPNQKMVSRVIPEGILPLDFEVEEDHDQRLEKFFAEIGAENFIIFGIGYEHLGFFRGPYTDETRVWIKTGLLVSPVVVMAENLDVILIADDTLSFSVIGGTSAIILRLDSSFGSHENLRNIFLSWAEEGGVGFGEEGRILSKEYLIPWCGWN